MSGIHSLAEWIAHYGGFMFFPLMYANGAGLPLIPAESLLLAGAVLADKGEINFAAMLISAFGGSVLGSMTGYFIGRLGGAALVARLTAFFRISPAKSAKFAALAEAKGIYFIIIARFIPIARELNGLIGGSLGMSFGRYMAGNCIGAFIWVLAWAGLPYFFGEHL